MFRDCAGRLGHSSDLGLFSWSRLSSLVHLVSCDLAGAGSPRVASGTWLTLASLLTGALCSSSSMWSPFLHQFRFTCALVSGFQAPQKENPHSTGVFQAFICVSVVVARIRFGWKNRPHLWMAGAAKSRCRDAGGKWRLVAVLQSTILQLAVVCCASCFFGPSRSSLLSP